MSNNIDPDKTALLTEAYLSQNLIIVVWEMISVIKHFSFSSVRNYVVQTVTGDGFGNGTDTLVYINLIGTLGDSGKRFLVHNMEETERKFQSGQVSIFEY